MLLAGSVNSDWYLGLTLGFVIVTVVVIVVAVILSYAGRIADQARLANEGLEDVRAGTEPLRAVQRTNAAGLAVLAAARTAREAVVARVTGVAPPAPQPAPAAPGPAGTAPSRSPASGPPVEPPGVLGPESYPSRGRFSRDPAPSDDLPGAPFPASDSGRSA